LKEIKENTFKERAVTGTAVIAVSTCIGSMLLEAPVHPSVYVSSAIGCIVAPYSAIQQEKITQVEALSQTNERLTTEAQELHEENIRLQTQVNDLEQSVVQLRSYTIYSVHTLVYSCYISTTAYSHCVYCIVGYIHIYIYIYSLEEMQKTLETVKAVEGQSLEVLEQQLETSKEILNRMQDNLMADILQSLITVVLGCDKDGDLQLSDDEINSLIVKMEGIHGIHLKQDLLRTKLVEQGRSLNAILNVCKNVLDNDVPADQNIFNFIETPNK
jgi:hypothetical protein